MSYQIVTYDWCGREVKSALNLYVQKPKTRQAYELNGRLYKTPEAAAKKEAWHFILTKYPELERVKKVLDIECDCAENDETGEYGEAMYKHEYCPLHSRQSGYFKRLHRRLVAHILKTWQFPA